MDAVAQLIESAVVVILALYNIRHINHIKALEDKVAAMETVQPAS